MNRIDRQSEIENNSNAWWWANELNWIELNSIVDLYKGHCLSIQFHCGQWWCCPYIYDFSNLKFLHTHTDTHILAHHIHISFNAIWFTRFELNIKIFDNWHIENSERKTKPTCVIHLIFFLLLIKFNFF